MCDNLHLPVPEKLPVIGIDNEEMIRYLSRVALSSVAQGTRQMGYQAAKLLHRLLNNEQLPLQRILVPPARVIERRSTDYRSLCDPAVIQAMHYIRNHACKGIKVEQVLDAVGISRSNLEKRFKEEVGETIHAIIHNEKLERARSLISSTSLSLSEISQMCGYPSLQYFYSVFKKAYGITPGEHRGEKQRNQRIKHNKKTPYEEGVFIRPGLIGGHQVLVALVHGKQIVIVALPAGGIPFELVDHIAGGHFLIRTAQFRALFTE
ncbi:Uncharacterized HTH-type transcriptional regulator ypdC [Shimwellia blattae]|nr:Uncharacterized HTH-type transcriptional regulator ypdC [Shimwellia blattae]